jgi:hypothetical protein
MTDSAPKKLILTSVNQVISLVKNNPQLVESLPRFSQIAGMSPSITPKKSCNCGAKQNFTTPDVNKQIAENLLSSLTAEDFLKIKNTLMLSELCYYKRNTELNKLELLCV